MCRESTESTVQFFVMNTKSQIPIPCRAKVATENGTVLGQYVGDVTVYVINHPRGALVSNKLAETRPTDEEVAKIGGTLEKIDGNPKIVLDNGEVVYGCQVWWEPLFDQN